ncbi:ABC transporter ATP-binding protein [Halopiger aswanensis]|uniref:ATP-binding cassette subfamily B protein n=1 Tax=Halopiger aswanensis TaxID=148449 RepID=A0A3R7HGW3_9EURY|nr:ABC transporter ATP-binding protein [Halopiger aswanensis]RKD93338.1 ATP-binding cassette subfamily B protein [Halopiger aswanensis]
MAVEKSTFEAYRDRVSKPLVRIFTTFGRDHWAVFGVGLVLNLIQRGASLVPPFILGVAIDAVFNQTRGYELPLLPAAWIPGDRAGQLWFSFGLIIGSYLLLAVSSLARGLCMDYFSHRVMHDVRTATYRKLQRLDMGFFESEDTGELMSVLNNDVSNFERFFDDAFVRASRIAAVLLGVTAILIYLNWQLALVTLSALPLLAVGTLLFHRLVEPAYDAIRSAVGSMNTRLENNLGGMQLIKSTATEEYENERVNDVSWNYFESNWWRIKLELLYHPGSRFLTNVAFGMTFLVGGVWLVSGPPGPFTGELSVGTLVTFLFMSQRIRNPMRDIASVVDLYENARASGKRVFGLLDMPVRITDAPDAEELPAVDGHVEYDSVTFDYANAIPSPADAEPDGGTVAADAQEGRDSSDDETDPVLKDVSFEAEPGETVALVGATGAGKSTVLKLLLRLYDVDEGSIRIDGYDLRDVTLASLRESIGYVSQETYLFGGTIRENIAYGRFDATDEEIREAAKVAEAHEFIERLPEGYDTQVGERGVRLSGGQRQRISIARTVVGDPDILIFDEATSAVDTETEMLIQRSLDRLSADRTTFIIAHRLSTIRDADKILVLDDGEIVERGTHDELLERDSLYANLWRVQAGQIDELPEEFIDDAIDRTSGQ